MTTGTACIECVSNGVSHVKRWSFNAVGETTYQIEVDGIRTPALTKTEPYLSL
jgi:hypothetical protein